MSIHPTEDTPQNDYRISENDYRYESNKINGYTAWHHSSFLSPPIMAANEFFYTGEGDKTTCFSCLTSVWKWEVGDNPNLEHIRWNRHCLFIRGLPCDNIPIDPDSNFADILKSNYDLVSYGRDLPGNESMDIAGNHDPNVHPPTPENSFLREIEQKLACLGLVEKDIPKNEEYIPRMQNSHVQV